jgi:hypothetical protein
MEWFFKHMDKKGISNKGIDKAANRMCNIILVEGYENKNEKES